MDDGSIKVGDVVAWGHVPDGVLVRAHDRRYFIKVRGIGATVSSPYWPETTPPWSGPYWWGTWNGADVDSQQVTIIATKITGMEAPETLMSMGADFIVSSARASLN